MDARERTRGVRAVAAIASLGVLFSPGARAAPPPPPATPALVSLAARFALKITSPGHVEQSSGRLALFPDGRVCILVDAPIRQHVLLTKEQVLVFYPDRDLLLRGRVRQGQAPPLLDAVAAGVGDPSRLVPADAVVLERGVAGGVLTTRWGVGRGASDQVRIAEARDGVRSIEIVSPGGLLRRRYDFGDRVAAGRARVPRSIRGDYRDLDGRPSRLEEWLLSEVGGAATEPVGRECAIRSARKVQEMAW